MRNINTSRSNLARQRSHKVDNDKNLNFKYLICLIGSFINLEQILFLCIKKIFANDGHKISHTKKFSLKKPQESHYLA